MIAYLVLIAFSILYFPIAYQDFKERMVSDVFIFLPYISFIVTLYMLGYRIIPYIISAAILAFAGAFLHKRGFLASGDVMAMPLIFSSAYAIEYVIIMTAAVFGIHMILFISKNGMKFNRRVSGDVAKRDTKWIPVKIDGQVVEGSIDEIYEKLSEKNVVDETYGVPLAGYIAMGNMLGVIIYSILVAI